MQNTPATQLIIHIGDPKTGTTSMQHALYHGLVKCDTRTILPWPARTAASLANGLKLKKNPALRQEPFGNVPLWLNGSDADLAVISSEFFAWTRPAVLRKALRDHVPDHADTARIIAYVRPHVSRFLAAYVQRTKSGRFSDDVETFFDRTSKTDLFRYSERFGNWRSAFGPQFTLRPFIRSQLRGGDIVTDFFTEILQDAPFAVEDAVEENVSVTTRSLAGLRHVHDSLNGTGIDPRGQRLIGEALANTFLPAQTVSGEKPKLDRKTVERLITAFSDDARALDAAFFDRPLMQDALQNSLNDTTDQPFCLTPETHFDLKDRAALDALSTEVAHRLSARRPLWAMHYNVGKGNLQPSEKQAKNIARHRAELDAIDAAMTEMARIIGG